MYARIAKYAVAAVLLLGILTWLFDWLETGIGYVQGFGMEG